MIFGAKRVSFFLLIGDIAAFAISLWLTLLVRYGEIPSRELLEMFVAPFTLLFILSVLVFYMAGLYGKRIALFPSRLPDVLLGTQITNTVLAALFFFFVPAFGIAPKTTLAIYLVISVASIYFWRLALSPKLVRAHPRFFAAIIAEGGEADELVREVNSNPRYGIEFRAVWKPRALPDARDFLAQLEKEHISIIVADTAQVQGAEIVPLMYATASVERRCQFAEFEDVYEEVFDRVPLSRLSYEWFLRNVSPANTFFYAVAKRVIDVVGGILMGIITVLVAPFIWLANRIEGSGPLFVRQDRLGERGTRIRTYKYRSMRFSDTGMWPGEGENRVTNVGVFLRKTSLDEFPQFMNVLKGELSLIGPRNDLAPLGLRLAEALPYYNARYLTKPGITGWAQINQQYELGNVSPQSIEETKTRLAYDFFYLKHRSLGLDIVIALKTIKRMFFRVSAL